MSNKIEKLISKMKRSKSDFTFEDCEKVLLSLGFVVKAQKGSHFRFDRDGKDFITIAKHIPVSKAAVKDVLEAWNTYGGANND